MLRRFDVWRGRTYQARRALGLTWRQIFGR